MPTTTTSFLGPVTAATPLRSRPQLHVRACAQPATFLSQKNLLGNPLGQAQFTGDRGSERLSTWLGVTQQGKWQRQDLNPALLTSAAGLFFSTEPCGRVVSKQRWGRPRSLPFHPPPHPLTEHPGPFVERVSLPCLHICSQQRPPPSPQLLTQTFKVIATKIIIIAKQNTAYHVPALFQALYIHELLEAPPEMRVTMTPFVHMSNLRHREVKQGAQGHTAYCM